MTPLGFEGAVLRSLNSVAGYRDRCEAERGPNDPPLDENLVALNGIAVFLKLQGQLIAHMALEPDTSEELMRNATHAAERVPAWMELRVYGGEGRQPGRKFALGCAQLIAEQRLALERILDEQVEEPEPIKEILAECPVPTGEEGESAGELLALARDALTANFMATRATARDLDEWLEEELNGEDFVGELDDDDLDEDEFGEEEFGLG